MSQLSHNHEILTFIYLFLFLNHVTMNSLNEEGKLGVSPMLGQRSLCNKSTSI